jgi:hypothetical protein
MTKHRPRSQTRKKRPSAKSGKAARSQRVIVPASPVATPATPSSPARGVSRKEAATSRLADYSYVLSDLRRITFLAVIALAIIVALAIVLR